MRCALINPPFCDPSTPPLGLAYLTAGLRSRDVDTVLFDANLAFWNRMERFDWIEYCASQITDFLESPVESREDMAHAVRAFLALARFNCSRGDQQVGETSSRTVESQYVQNQRRWRSLLELTSAAHKGIRLGLGGLQIQGGWSDIERLAQLAEEPSNLFHKWLRDENGIEAVQRHRPDWIGISITYEDQLLPAFALARHLKKLTNATLVFGGGLIRSFSRLIGHTSPLWSFADGIVLGPGEAAVELLEVSTKTGLVAPIVPCLTHEHDKWVLDLRDRHIEPPRPDFSLFPLDRYLSQGIVLPYRVFSSCQWGRCSFCADKKYRYHKPACAGHPGQIAEELTELAEEYGAQGFYFLDAEFPDSFMLSLAKTLKEISNRPLFHWGVNARFTPRLTHADNANRLHQSGCSFLRLGLESASPRMLRLMNKGVSPKLASEVLKTLHHAQILTHVYLMIGFPGESASDWRKTRDFVLGNATHIDMYSVSPFTLYEGSPLWEHPEGFGAKITCDASELRWDYPSLSISEGPDDDSWTDRVRDLRVEFMKIHGSTRCCANTADTIILSGRMKDGVTWNLKDGNKVAFCGSCRARVRLDRIQALSFSISKAARRLNNGEAMAAMSTDLVSPSALIFDGSAFWQAPVEWAGLHHEMSVREAANLMGGDREVGWAVGAGFIQLKSCPENCRKDLLDQSEPPSCLIPVEIPSGHHFDGYFEEPDS